MKEHTNTAVNSQPDYHLWLGLAPDSEMIPDALKALGQWVVWCAEPKSDGRRSKVPYSASTGRKASSSNPRTWSDWETAWAAYEEAPGVYAVVGFVLTDSDQLVGIDLDHCVDAATGIPTPEAASVIERCATYAKRSPSGTGVRIIGYGDQFTAACPDRGIEIYSHARFLTITGRRLTSGDLGTIPDQALRELAAAARAARTDAGQRDRAATVTLALTQIVDLRSALASMRSDDRDLWVRMGLALKELGDVGRGLWLEWSQTSEKYDAQDAARVWDSLQPKSTGYAAAFATARRGGWVNPTGEKAHRTSPSWQGDAPPPDAEWGSKFRDAATVTGGDWPQPKPITAELMSVCCFQH